MIVFSKLVCDFCGKFGATTWNQNKRKACDQCLEAMIKEYDDVYFSEGLDAAEFSSEDDGDREREEEVARVSRAK